MANQKLIAVMGSLQSPNSSDWESRALVETIKLVLWDKNRALVSGCVGGLGFKYIGLSDEDQQNILYPWGFIDQKTKDLYEQNWTDATYWAERLKIILEQPDGYIFLWGNRAEGFLASTMFMACYLNKQTENSVRGRPIRPHLIVAENRSLRNQLYLSLSSAGINYSLPTLPNWLDIGCGSVNLSFITDYLILRDQGEQGKEILQKIDQLFGRGQGVHWLSTTNIKIDGKDPCYLVRDGKAHLVLNYLRNLGKIRRQEL
jgi:hypothetical protein